VSPQPRSLPPLHTHPDTLTRYAREIADLKIQLAEKDAHLAGGFGAVSSLYGLQHSSSRGARNGNLPGLAAPVGGFMQSPSKPPGVFSGPGAWGIGANLPTVGGFAGALPALTAAAAAPPGPKLQQQYSAGRLLPTVQPTAATAAPPPPLAVLTTSKSSSNNHPGLELRAGSAEGQIALAPAATAGTTPKPPSPPEASPLPRASNSADGPRGEQLPRSYATGGAVGGSSRGPAADRGLVPASSGKRHTVTPPEAAASPGRAAAAAPPPPPPAPPPPAAAPAPEDTGGSSSMRRGGGGGIGGALAGLFRPRSVKAVAPAAAGSSVNGGGPAAPQQQRFVKRA